MSDKQLTQDEVKLLAIVRDLRPFETIEIKIDEKGNVVFTYTRKDRYTMLTN